LYRLFKQPKVQEFVTQLQTQYPNQYNQLHGVINNQTLHTNTMIKTFVDKYRLDSKRLVHSVGETMIVYKLGFPILVPLHFWATIHMLKKPSVSEPFKRRIRSVAQYPEPFN
jgi:hypothetical protein